MVSLIPFDYGTLATYYTSGAALGLSQHAEVIRNGPLSDFFARDRVDVIPPWDFPEPILDDSSSAVLGRVLSLKPLLYTADPSFDRPGVDDDFKKLFALHQGLGRMRELAEFAQTRKGETLAPILDKAFQGYLDEVKAFLGETQFKGFADSKTGDALSASLAEAYRNFQDGLGNNSDGEFVEGISVLSGLRTDTLTSTIEFETDDPIDTKFGLTIRKNFEGAIVSTEDNVALSDLTGTETFTIAVTENSTTTNVSVDLSGAASTGLTDIVTLINSELATAGFDTFAQVKTHTTEKYGLEFSLADGEELAFSTAGTTSSAVYVTGRGGSGDLAQGFLMKLDDLSAADPTQVFYDEVNATDSFESSNAVAVDSNGFTYTVGTTAGSLDDQVNDDGSDAYLIKYDHSGSIMFTRLLGSASDTTAFGVAVDSSNNVLVTGQTYGQLTDASYGGDSDTFVTKFDSEGLEQWTRQLSPTAVDAGLALTTDSSNNVYIVGFTDGAIGSTETAAGGRDGFLTKLDTDGTLVYDHQIGDSGAERATAVVVDSSNNVWVAGTDDGNGFLIKYDDSSGTPSETYNVDLGSLGTDGDVTGVALDSAGDVYVVGSTTNTALSGSVVDAHSGGLDAFVLKVDDQTSSAVEEFVTYSGTSSDDEGGGIAIDTSDNSFYIGGNTAGVFSGETQSNTVDGFVTKFNSSGTSQYNHQFGSAYENRSFGIVFDSDGTSVLSILGLPNGNVPVDDTTELVAQTSVRAGQSFTVNVNNNGPERVTIEDDDSLRGLAFKINAFLDNNGKAFVEKDGLVERLVIVAQNAGEIIISGGPDGFDALPGLGLTPTRLLAANFDVETGQEVDDGIFELGLTTGINVATTEDAADAFLLLDGARLELEKAFDFITIGGQPPKPPAPTGPPPAFLQKQIAQLTLALNRLSSPSASQGSLFNLQI